MTTTIPMATTSSTVTFVFVERLSRRRWRLQCRRDDGATGLQQRREDVSGIEAALVQRAQHRRQDLLRLGATDRAVAAAGHAGDDRRADRVLRAPVRGVDGRVAQTRQQGRRLPRQMRGDTAPAARRSRSASARCKRAWICGGNAQRG